MTDKLQIPHLMLLSSSMWRVQGAGGWNLHCMVWVCELSVLFVPRLSCVHFTYLYLPMPITV